MSILGLILIAAGAGLLVWSSWRLAPDSTRTILLPADALAVPGSVGTGSLEGRQVQLQFPSQMRLGETGRISLLLVPATRGETRPAGGVNVEAESWLDLPGAAVSPAEVSSTALLAGRTIRFDWQVSATTVGTMRGRAWLDLRFLSASGTADARKPVSAQPVSIQVISLLGLGVAAVRAAGAATAVAGILILLSRNVRRRRKRSSQEIKTNSKPKSMVL